MSGAKTERLGLTAALDACRAGDILVVWKLNRLGRSLAHLVATVEDLAGRSVGFRSLQEQLDTALRLVSWSWIARECGVQIALIDVLADAGAALDGNPDNALVNGNREAAAHMVERGAKLTLGTALCLERWEDVGRLMEDVGDREKQFALVLAALNGRAEALRRILPLGVELNAPSPDLYSHATALHHAVWSGSLDAVRVLVDAGADLAAKDEAWHGTPLNWAEHSENEEIASYLREREKTR